MAQLFVWLETSFKGSMNWWLQFIDPLCNPEWISGLFILFSAIGLVWVLRWQIKNTKPWHLDGVELIAAGVIGALSTGLIYGFPLFLWAAAGGAILQGVLYFLTWIAGLGTGK